jgi:hypothetical protein
MFPDASHFHPIASYFIPIAFTVSFTLFHSYLYRLASWMPKDM